MKQISIALVLFLTMSAHTCNKKTAEAAGNGDAGAGMANLATMTDTKWVLQTLKGNHFTMPEGVEAPWLRLVKAENRIEGFTGCNHLLGQFSLAGDQVSFPGMGSTKKYCEPTQAIENSYVGALNKVQQFKVVDGVLHLMGETGADLATFTKE
jgi:putative lipoprotein